MVEPSSALSEPLEWGIERLRALLDRSWDVLSLLDGEGRLLYNSPAAERLHGLDPKEMIGRSTLEYIHPDDVAIVGEAFQRCLAQPGEPVTVEYRYRRRGGGWLWMEAIGVNLLDDPAVGGVVVNSRDISGLKEAEEARRESDANFRVLFECLPAGVLVYGADARLRMANPAALALLGCTGADLIGRTPDDAIWGFLEPDLRPISPAAHPVVEALAYGLPLHPRRLGFHRGTGELRWVDCQVTPVRHAEGHIDSVVMTLTDVTEQQRMQRALEENQEIFSDFMRHSPIHVYIKEVSPTESWVLQASDNFAEMIGLPASEMVGRSMSELFPEPFASKITADDWAVASGGEVLRVEEELNGRSYTTFKFPIHRDQRVLVAGYTIDITERRGMEEALRRESKLLQDVIDHNPMSLQLLDRDGRTLKVNPAHTRLFGAAPPPGYSVFADPSLRAQGLGELLERVQAGEVVAFPVFHYNAHEVFPDLPDVPVWIRMVAFPIRGKDGAPERFVLMHEDVTERTRVEASLRESEARNRALICAIPDLVFIQDAEGVFLDCHAGSTKRLLIPPENFLGRPMAEVMSEGLTRQWKSAAARAQGSGDVQRFEYSLELEGGPLHYEARVAPCGKNLLLTLVRDVTEYRRTEQLLRQSQKLESLGVLAGGIAHDFNNLLTAMLGNLNLAQLKLSPESPAHPHLDAVESTVLKASELTRQMLAYSGKGAFVVKRQNLNRMVEEMGHLLEVSISKKTRLRLHLAARLPAIEGDSAQLQQVIMNLVTNASDAIGDAEGCIRITTQAEELDAATLAQAFPGQHLKPGLHVALEVNDTGCGIPPEILGRIFDPFFSTKATGRGLGLSAMHGILRGHGAGIQICSEVGRGSTFKVFFPAVPAVPDEAASGPGIAAGGARMKGRVLVVDDEPVILETLADSLRAFGLEVSTARDGLEAVEGIRSGLEVDLVLMDLTMPRMDGREAFRHLRELRPGLPVLLSSGYSEKESLQDSLGAGLAGFIQKPYQLRELRRAVEGALRKGRHSG